MVRLAVSGGGTVGNDVEIGKSTSVDLSKLSVVIKVRF